LDDGVRDVMWKVFVHICEFWHTVVDPSEYRSRFDSFMDNRMSLDPRYALYYRDTAAALEELIAQVGEPTAYQRLLTDAALNVAPPTTPLMVARQRVSNEFVSLHLALGGFASFGATNYLGYIYGPNVPGQPAPYRT
jgi:hypothetical protein